MDMQALLEQLKTALSELFRRGSRYQTEKIGTVVVYFVLVIGSLVWGFSGKKYDNELGADFGLEKLVGIDRQVYFLENLSGDTWHRVRVVINNRYLYKRDVLKPEDRALLGPQDFAYFYYIPRSWGRSSWELLAKEPKPSSQAPDNIEPQIIQIRADEGKLDLDLSKKRAGAGAKAAKPKK